MATYASEKDLAAYVADNPEVQPPGEPEALERLLERAERAVDGVLGPYTPDPETGLKLDLSSLTNAQKAALSRATCAAAEYELVVGPEVLAGGDEWLPATLTVVRSAGRTAPKMLEELAGSGSGLIKWSGCAGPTPS
jgi:hypothetical protein